MRRRLVAFVRIRSYNFCWPPGHSLFQAKTTRQNFHCRLSYPRVFSSQIAVAAFIGARTGFFFQFVSRVAETNMWLDILDYGRDNASQILVAVAVILALRVLYSVVKTRLCFYRILKQGLVGG